MVEARSSVCVIGLGYIGLPTAVFFASAGLQVTGVDINPSLVEQVNGGKLPFVEPGLDELLRTVVADGKLRASTEIPEADAHIVAVPTPFTEGHAVDARYIAAAAAQLAPRLRGGELVVLESTSPPGTTERMGQMIVEHRPDLTLEPGHPHSILVAHCPERVLPGKIMEEMAANDRIVGGTTPEATARARSLYGAFVTGELLETDATTAEMAKLTENSFRDVNIAFANELSLVCDQLGIDVWELIRLANRHPRVNILQPGPGVGGHCIAVDPWFIVSSAPGLARLIRTAREVNDAKPQWVIDQVRRAAAEVTDPVIAALGIAFKPDIDDLRESPSLEIVRQLAAELPEARLRVVEPNIRMLPETLAALSNVELTNLDPAVDGADVVLLLVDHSPFKSVDRARLAGKSVVDTRGLWA